MNKPRSSNRRQFCAGLLYFATFNGAAALANAPAAADRLAITSAWQPQMPKVVKVNAGYFTVHNQSSERVDIVQVSSPNFETVAIHRSVLKHNSVSMEPVSGLALAPGETIRLAPHGLHLMMLNAKFEHQKGELYPVVLHFSDGQKQTFSMQVVATDCEHCDDHKYSHQHEH